MRDGIAEITEIAERGRYDLKLVLATVALVALGLVMIASASQMVKLQRASGIRPRAFVTTRWVRVATEDGSSGFRGTVVDLDALAEDSARDGRYTAMFTSSPLNLRGGVGSPPNALAIK